MSEVYTSIEEVLPVLRTKLLDYLAKRKILDNPKKPFKCIFHDDGKTPNMFLNPKNGYQSAHCFSCGTTKDLFTFAEQIDQLPSNGPDWVKITIPTLCKEFNIPLSLGELSQQDKDKVKLLKLCRDITDILDTKEFKGSYGEERGWNNENIVMASISENELIEKLGDNGWDIDYLITSGIIKTREEHFFGLDKFTFVIEDAYKRPIGFISRNLSNDAEKKYVHGFDSLILKKSKLLFGLNVDLQKCKKEGLYIVEGPGDALALISNGFTNAAAIFGTALTEDHLLELKKLNIRKVILSLDWDDAGIKATERIVENILPKVQDISFYIKTNNTDFKDPDELIKSLSVQAYKDLSELSVFEWQLEQSKGLPTEQLCDRMVKLIASEPSAIRRSLMMQELSKVSEVPVAAIEVDVTALRDIDLSEKKLAMVGAAQEFQLALEKEPDNYITLMANLEDNIQKIEKKYAKSVVGVNYQLQRYEDIQKIRELNDSNRDFASFKFEHFQDFGEALSGGMPYTRGCLIYLGGRANSGKTLSALAIAGDIALHDDDAMTIIHSIDDSYEQIEPRIKTNLYNMYYKDEPILTLDQVVSPYKYDDKRAAKKADDLFKQLLAEERIILLDNRDGSNLTALERQWRYYRTRYPSKKLLGICDNTHDYEDYAHLERTARMTMIASTQKRLTSKYDACLIATAEYRKADRSYTDKIVFPTNDDLADARALAYRPNIICHVYNDLADRGDKAEIFWINPDTGEKSPRLLWLFTKNKINSFKGKLVRDVNKLTVSCTPKDISIAKREWENPNNSIPEKTLSQIRKFDEELGYETETEYEEVYE